MQQQKPATVVTWQKLGVENLSQKGRQERRRMCPVCNVSLLNFFGQKETELTADEDIQHAFALAFF